MNVSKLRYQGQYEQAFRQASRLASDGDAEAARLAVLTARFGPSLADFCLEAARPE